LETQGAFVMTPAGKFVETPGGRFVVTPGGSLLLTPGLLVSGEAGKVNHPAPMASVRTTNPATVFVDIFIVKYRPPCHAWQQNYDAASFGGFRARDSE
jgi:hypothetical protein